MRSMADWRESTWETLALSVGPNIHSASGCAVPLGNLEAEAEIYSLRSAVFMFIRLRTGHSTGPLYCSLRDYHALIIPRFGP